MEAQPSRQIESPIIEVEEVNNTDQLSPEDVAELDRRSEATAREFVTDIVHFGQPLPTRFLFSGLLDQPFATGFQENSFVVDAASRGFGHGLLRTTKNDGLTRGSGPYVFEQLHGGLENIDLFNPDVEMATLEIIRERYPDLHDQVVSRLDENRLVLRALYQERGNAVDNDESRRIGHAIDEQLLIRKGLLPNIDAYLSVMQKYGDPNKQDLAHQIIRNFLSEKPFENWSFEEQEYLYDSLIAHITEGKIAEQVYDSAIIVDPGKIASSKEGYLPGIERQVIAPPSSILGIVDLGELQGVLPKQYLIEKAKRIYRQNPDLARPIYDPSGNLLWPDDMKVSELAPIAAEKKKRVERQKRIEAMPAIPYTGEALSSYLTEKLNLTDDDTPEFSHRKEELLQIHPYLPELISTLQSRYEEYLQQNNLDIVETRLYLAGPAIDTTNLGPDDRISICILSLPRSVERQGSEVTQPIVEELKQTLQALCTRYHIPYERLNVIVSHNQPVSHWLPVQGPRCLMVATEAY